MFDFFERYYTNTNHIIYHLIIMIGLSIGSYRFQKLSISSRIFLLLLFISLVIEWLAFWSAIKYRNNWNVYNPFNLLQCLLVAMAFYTETRSKIILVMYSCYLVFALLNGIYFQPFLKVGNTNSLLVENLFIIIWYFTYLVILFKRTDLAPIKYYPLFWVGIGWLIFCVVSIVSFGFSKLYVPGDTWDDISTWTKRISNYILYASFIPAFLSPQKSLNDPTTG